MFKFTKTNRAAVIMPKEADERLIAICTFTPSFMKGDLETQVFAKRSRHAMNVGGVSIAMSDKISVEDCQRIVNAVEAILNE